MKKKKLAAVLAISIFSSVFCGNALANENTGKAQPINSKDVIYQIITDRFYDGDKQNNIPEGFDPALFDGTGADLKLYQGGDWEGIIKQIPYLKEMGITCVWISAPYANRDSAIVDKEQEGNKIWTSFHGYHVKNYYGTNLHFGDMQEFERLKDELHRNGMKLVVDFVTNHTSRWENPTDNFSAEDGRLYEPDKNEKGEYVFDANGDLADYNGDGIVHNLVADPHNDTKGWFHGIGDRGKDESKFGFRHKDLGSLADFSQENEEVVHYLEEAMKFWAEKGIDGIRHDATLHMNPAFIKGLKDEVDSSPAGPLYHFGEFFIEKPDNKYKEYATFPERTGVHNLDFEFYRTMTSTFGRFTTNMNDFAHMLMYTKDDYIYENQAVTFIDNHDVTRFGCIQRNHKPYNGAIAALMTSRGIPNIYYGTEQYVTPNSTSDIAGRVFMEKTVGFDTTSIAFQTIKHLSQLRQDNNALAYGTTKILYSNDDVVVFERQFYEDKVVVAINRQPDREFYIPAIPTALEVGEYPDYLEGMLGGNAIKVVSNGQENILEGFSLSGGEVAVWESENATTNNKFSRNMALYGEELTTPSAITIQSAITTPSMIRLNDRKSIVPKIGQVTSIMGRPGNIVYIYGDDFGSNPKVKFGNNVAEVIEANNTKITCKVPYMEAGETQISVSTNGKTSNEYRYDVLTGDQTQMIFHVVADTNMGENIYVVGNRAELGNWDSAKATEAMMCPNYPEYFLPVSVPKGEKIEFKFIKKDKNGNVVWEEPQTRVIQATNKASGVVDTPVYTFGLN